MKRITTLALLISLAAVTGFSSRAFGRNRYVSPTLSRFTQRDPKEYIDGNNLFAYAGIIRGTGWIRMVRIG